jgi:uncharacterized protein YaaR (DUF327 family)
MPLLNSPFKTPKKNIKSSFLKTSHNNEFKIESPTSKFMNTPSSIRNSQVYKDIDYYDNEYEKYIDEMIRHDTQLPSQHKIDIELHTCNLKDHKLTKTINKILKGKNDGQFHYKSCKGPPCLCSTIQSFLWN